MLKKENRLILNKARNKSEVFESQLFKIKSFVVGQDQPRFAFVVSKKIDKRAVVRNRTKRILKKATAVVLKSVNQNAGVLVIAKKALEIKQQQEVNDTMEKAFKAVSILK